MFCDIFAFEDSNSNAISNFVRVEKKIALDQAEYRNQLKLGTHLESRGFLQAQLQKMKEKTNQLRAEIAL